MLKSALYRLIFILTVLGSISQATHPGTDDGGGVPPIQTVPASILVLPLNWLGDIEDSLNARLVSKHFLEATPTGRSDCLPIFAVAYQ